MQKFFAAILLTMLALASIAPDSSALPLRGKSAKKVEPTWEVLVKKGNIYMARERMPDARKLYRQALKVLEDQNCMDLRKAIVLHDLAETYRVDSNWHAARLHDLKSSAIYQHEIENNQLGSEYSHSNPVKVDAASLKPACPVCHENWKVVPIHYGKSSGYPDAVPHDSSPSYTHKPGGEQVGDQRWYCRVCHQSF